ADVPQHPLVQLVQLGGGAAEAPPITDLPNDVHDVLQESVRGRANRKPSAPREARGLPIGSAVLEGSFGDGGIGMTSEAAAFVSERQCRCRAIEASPSRVHAPGCASTLGCWRRNAGRGCPSRRGYARPVASGR